MLLKELSNAIGISGEEDEVRKIVVDAITPHVADLTVDSIGNITAIQKGTQYPEYTIMIAAHMDEIGMMVTAVDSNGLIQFTNVGGIDARILPGLRVKVGKKKTPGVILWKPIHFGRNSSVVGIDNLRIDVGSTDKSSAELGDRIAFDSFYAELSEKIVRGKAFDDRVGCSVLIDILQNGPYPVTVAATFSVQEEIGLRGAQIAAHRLNPDAAIVLEGTTAHDVPTPDLEIDAGDLPSNAGCKLGAGAVLTLMDASMVTDPRVLRFLRETADTNDIPYQFKTVRGGGTDGGRIHVNHTGVPTMVISTPCRYIHSPTALMNTDDYGHVLNLSQTVLKTITPDTFTQD
jgi:tetrahedral aminopeptidase